ncbi:unnamed protein product [Ectocarpus sp. 6 AP-2014]
MNALPYCANTHKKTQIATSILCYRYQPDCRSWQGSSLHCQADSGSSQPPARKTLLLLTTLVSAPTTTTNAHAAPPTSGSALAEICDDCCAAPPFIWRTVQPKSPALPPLHLEARR